MRKNDEARRGGNLGRAPERVCSAADTRKTSLNRNGGQRAESRAKSKAGGSHD
jgi:hypothetical protein